MIFTISESLDLFILNGGKNRYYLTTFLFHVHVTLMRNEAMYT